MEKKAFLLIVLIAGTALFAGCIQNKVEESESYSLPGKKKTCVDEEIGIDYYVDGELTVCDFVSLEEPGGSPIGCALHNDLCGSDPGILFEKYCAGDELKFEQYTCPNGCKNGACVR